MNPTQLDLQSGDDLSLATLRPAGSFGSTNGGWCYDAYPELEPLKAGSRICIGDIEGPAVITQIHSTVHAWKAEHASSLMARAVILEVEFDECPELAVRVPLGDFFADGNGLGEYFTTPFVEHAPKSYNCFIPMPFARRARVWLRNESQHDLNNYSFVEFRRLPQWDTNLGYFHATWRRWAFALNAATDQHFFHVDGRGHLLGTTWTITTDEPYFRGMHFVMEGNVGVRVDGSLSPVADYLGSEDSFGFSWGFQAPFAGLHNGLTFISREEPAQVIAYRFRDRNVIAFGKSLDVRVDWTHEWRDNEQFQTEMRAISAAGGGIVDYATVWYWYQDHPGFDHGPLMLCEDRAKSVLRSSAQADGQKAE